MDYKVVVTSDAEEDLDLSEEDLDEELLTDDEDEENVEEA